MLKVHHLERSRSARLIWLMEELGLPYELIRYQRNPLTIRAPAELKAVHPLGKAPILDDDGQVIAESSAIIEYVVDRYGQGRLAPARTDPEHAAYLEWLHMAESTAMFPIMVTRLGAFTGGLSAGLAGFMGPEVELMLDYISTAVGADGYLLKSGFSAADIQMSYVVGSARGGGMLAARPQLTAYLDRLQARPAYKRMIEKGGPVYVGE